MLNRIIWLYKIILINFRGLNNAENVFGIDLSEIKRTMDHLRSMADIVREKDLQPVTFLNYLDPLSYL